MASSGKGSASAVHVVVFDRDLRLADHSALTLAAQSGPVLAVYLASDAKLSGFGAARKWWLHHSLAALDADLADYGGGLVLLRGKTDASILAALIAAVGATSVDFSSRCGHADGDDDDNLLSAIENSGALARVHSGQLLHDPENVLTGIGTAYRVYTPFWRAVSPSLDGLAPCPPPPTIEFFELTQTSDAFRHVSLDDLGLLPRNPDWSAGIAKQWVPGEKGAHERLEAFLETGLRGYGEDRNRPDLPSTSMLSPHLAFGEISPTTVLARIERARGAYPSDDVTVFRKEMVWRDFSYHLLHHNPNLATENFNGSFDALVWENDASAFKAWTKGLTGFPIVDAGMRQLWETGWMHNRVRMIVASFLTKHLLIDWRKGERWFWDTLVDADPASNAASWQWVAGTGADAAPYFRVFNPILQGKKFDPDGTYVRQFIPELAGLPSDFIHEPWNAPDIALVKAGIRLGTTYPQPIIDHAKGRERALAAYQSMREAS